MCYPSAMTEQSVAWPGNTMRPSLRGWSVGRQSRVFKKARCVLVLMWRTGMLEHRPATHQNPCTFSPGTPITAQLITGENLPQTVGSAAITAHTSCV